MSHNQRIGKWGEETAAEYLTQHGYKIIARNVRTPYGEIDIVSKQGDTTIFVEVKTRTSNTMGLPEEAITLRKREHMLAAADHYAAEHAIDNWQIDVMSIEGKPGSTPKITYFENAITWPLQSLGLKYLIFSVYPYHWTGLHIERISSY